MTTDRALENFIGDTFVSVWSLELLSLLMESADAGLSRDELVERLRASDSVVSQGVAALVSAGLAVVNADDKAEYRPIDESLDRCARESVDFYRKFPGRARRLIIARAAPGLTAFADAFRLGKE